MDETVQEECMGQMKRVKHKLMGNEQPLIRGKRREAWREMKDLPEEQDHLQKQATAW